jgi:nitric oxide dioxygenase
MKTLSPETITIVKSTAAIMQAHGLAITTRMYERLFVDPEMKDLFEKAASNPEEQPKRLAGALLAFASHVDNLDMLTAAIERIAERHVALHVKAEHYPVVADALLPAIKDVLGDVADERILNAWAEAYWFLADVLKRHEYGLYTSGT